MGRLVYYLGKLSSNSDTMNTKRILKSIASVGAIVTGLLSLLFTSPLRNSNFVFSDQFGSDEGIAYADVPNTDSLGDLGTGGCDCCGSTGGSGDSAGW